MTDESLDTPVKALSRQHFVHETLNREVFIHFFQQLDYVYRKYRPTTMLEIGPGDHTVTDFLRRRGIVVKTLDATAELRPDYLCDVRHEFPISEKFDLVLASEVFEHVDIKYLGRILENVKKVLKPGGHLVVSLPYASIRLFPKNKNYGRIISCDGRLKTRIPWAWVQPVYSLLRGIYRFLILRYTFKGSFRFYRIPDLPDEEIVLHHWEVGRSPTTRKFVRAIFEQHFTILEEGLYPETNAVFFVLRNDGKA